MRRSNATTLQDVAREAGVTVMAASVVLNGATSSARVSEATRARIKDVAARLNYSPNAVARGLNRRCMNTIGVVAIIDSGEFNLYFLALLNGILEEASQRDQNTIVFSIQDWQDEARILRSLDGRVDGLILLAPKHLSPAFAAVLHERTPYVSVHGNSPPSPAHNLEVDNESGGYQMTKYMIDQGHTRIAHFTGMIGLRGADQRLAGYKRALGEANLPVDPKLIFDGHFSRYSGRCRAAQLVERCRADGLPTAIFCASDAIATGCIEVLQENGISVPTDISVGGFDGVPLTDVNFPPLTTVRQPFRQLGHRAVAYLIAQIRAEPGEPVRANGAEEASREEIFEVSLAIRQTVTAPAQKI